MGIQDYGLPGQTLKVPELASWAKAVADAIVLDGPLSSRFAAIHSHFFDSAKAVNVPVPDTAWVTLATLPIVDAPAGTYMVGFSMEWSYANVTNSVLLRLSNDGGATWISTYSFEPKDATDRTLTTYEYPKDYDGVTPVTLMAQIALETATPDIATVHFFDIWAHKVS